jgi:hypothetical protein
MAAAAALLFDYLRQLVDKSCDKDVFPSLLGLQPSMILLFATLAGATTPQLNGLLIRPGEACYSIGRSGPDGLAPFGTMRMTVKRLKHKGVAALEIMTHQQLTSPRGPVNLKDFYLVRRKDLRPISYRSEMSGKTTVRLDYGRSRVLGTREVKGATIPIDQALGRPTWDGNLYGLTLGYLPLKPNASYQVPVYHYSDGLGEFTINVVGEAQVETPSGSEQAWVIEVYRDPARVARYFISKESRAELGYEAMGIVQSLSKTCPPLQ